ncbi:MAG: hypothetical protein ABF506_07910 [Zymomonas mobilis]|uniref:hypothetical protein n=1 Tax=Zymomonas mobilis TaxID=542 RepID=UPI0039ECF181
MELVVPRNRDLSDLFSHAPSVELDVLADLITDDGNGRVSLNDQIKAIIINRKKQGNLQDIPDILEAEIRAFGGNTLVNVFRPKGVSYQELAINVAKKLNGKPTEESDIFSIEDIVIRQAIYKFSNDRVNVEGLNKTALIDCLASLVSASRASLDIMASGRAAWNTGNVGGIFTSLTVTSLTVAASASLSSPAFRIIIPAVLQIAKIRRIRYESDFAIYTETLQACL